ncbi:MAG: ester cyclase [Candidatus Zixiibacteriota bacterium]|nr:MAG: ester cyclase [candidate division Zixibacteria bacterium]
MYRVIVTLTFVALLLIVVAGCTQETRTTLKSKSIVRQGLEALDNQEYDRLSEFFAEDFKRHCQATPDVQVNSLDEMIGFVKTWYEAFPDMRAEYHSIIAEGDLVAVYATFVGTHQAPLGDIPATGKTMDSETFAIFRVENDKIVESWVTWDNLAVMKQLGLMPPAPEESSGDM